MGTASTDQDAFAWLEDDGDLEVNSAIGSTNDNLVSPTLDANYRLRFLIQNTGNKDENDQTYGIQYKLNAGAWTTVDAASSVVRSFASVSDPNPGDGDTTAQRIGAGIFDEGYFAHPPPTTTFVLAQAEESELEFCVQFRSADLSNADVVLIQVVGTTLGDLDLYTNTPSTTIVAAVEKTGSVTADAAIEAEQTGSITADAAIERARTGSVTADAAVEKEQTGSVTADATITVPAEDIGAFAWRRQQVRMSQLRR